MAPDLLRFRCYRCNQLLAVAPSKVGAVVSCPRCKAELQVPGGEPQAKGQSESRAKRQAASPPAILKTETGAVIPPELAELRPEDLRVEAEFFANLTRSAQAPAEPQRGGAPDAAALFPPLPETPLVDLPKAELSRLLEPQPPAAPAVAEVVPQVGETPTPPPEVGAVLPPIEVEVPTILPPGAEIRPLREVVLPATVVLAWSLFVLAGIAFSFVAGLMIGHFLWRVH